MSQTKHEIRYPNFWKEPIDTQDENATPRSIISFPFATKGKRRTDLISLSYGARNGVGSVVMMENSHNWDSTKTTRDEEDYDRWDKITICNAHSPSYALPVDISGNDYNDLIVTCEYGESPDEMDPFGGRICWLENPGADADEGEWVQRDIGRFPGVNLVKGKDMTEWVGHFTTTFSLQAIAIAKSTKTDTPSPLILFTKPPDPYTSRQWLFTVALDTSFTSIQDLLVVKSKDEGLDTVIVSSDQGISLARYSNRNWHQKALDITNPGLSHLSGQLCAGAIRKEPVSFIVCGERQRRGSFTILQRHSCPETIGDFVWIPRVVEVFTDGDESYSVQDIVCADIDGDDVDEIIVSVDGSGPKCGVYVFDLQGDQIVKSKISEEGANNIAFGRFGSRYHIDLAILSNSFSSVSLLHNHFVPSLIRPTFSGSELSFRLPRSPSFASEADILSICGLTLSLVILPPDASFHLSSWDDGAEAVKVLHGSLGWIDQSSGGTIERTRFPGPPGRAISMIVDCYEGLVRSGNDGAVFIRLRPSHLTDDTSLRTLNVLPAYFPCDVREHVFSWHVNGVEEGIELNDEAPQSRNEGKGTFLTSIEVDYSQCRISRISNEWVFGLLRRRCDN
ncbi:hypothetical protein SCHPADRAFT_832978 [Schizopora paradoxa]|uniref:Uncharacterized protein n=1 Tax=Schizopora paradoxa TaxID=27342 RepID=A0A0H2RE61_9AGAM|nr:hypothetical protein SCHPADRAFT_832978 [Schizopora paradoxa]